MRILQQQQRDVQDYVPDYVINHGVMKAGDYQHLLRRSKVFWDQTVHIHTIRVYFKLMSKFSFHRLEKNLVVAIGKTI